MRRLFSILILMLLCAPTIGAQELTTADLATFKKNIITHHTKGQPRHNERVERLLDQQREDGSWDDIDYQSREKSKWPSLNHITNMLAISISYASPSSELYHDAEAADSYVRAMNYYNQVRPESDNWWHGDIGVPKSLVASLILMEDVLTKDQLLGIRWALDRSKISMTGQNRVWLAGIVLYRGVLYGDVEDVVAASQTIKSEIVVTNGGEGIQFDNSYHQHGPQQQFGNYGLAYADHISTWANIFAGTSCRFSAEQMSILRNYLLEGQQWVVWRNQMDISSIGRQHTPGATKSKCSSYYGSLAQFKAVDKGHEREYDKARDYRKLEGHKHFWCSDYPIMRRKDFYFSVKMCSSRVVGAESCNSEHLKGYYSGDGVALLYCSGEEYRDIAPFWEWRKLPGVTLAQSGAPYKVLRASGYHINSDFVGGVSSGECGVAAMRYIREGVEADKSWFMFDDMIVCLGSGISSTTGFEVTTTLNQVYSEGDVITSKGEADDNFSSSDVQWAWHDNVGYILPEGGNFHLSRKEVTSSWQEIAASLSPKQMTDDITTLWFSHGVKPEDDKYAYVLVPNCTAKRTKSLSRKLPYRILNEDDLQVVEAVNGERGGAVCYTAATVDMLGGITLSEPAIIYYERGRRGRVSLYVSDPTRKLSSLKITLGGDYRVNGKREVEVELPRGGMAGSSYMLELKK